MIGEALDLDGGRVATAIGEIRANPGLGNLPEEAMALTLAEHAVYQDKQAAVFSSGVLTSGEAQLVYRSLGEHFNPDNGGWANGADKATKVVITKVVAELMGAD